MKDKFQQIECSDNDVLEFEDKMYRVGQIRQALYKSSEASLAFKLQQNLEDEKINLGESCDNIFTTGVECEILTLGSTKWKKGRFRFKMSIELYVENEEDTELSNNTSLEKTEPESPLDDLRKMMNELEK